MDMVLFLVVFAVAYNVGVAAPPHAQSDTSPSRTRLDLLGGDLTFAAGMLVFATIAFRALPYDYTDLCYLLSLERGEMVAQEWVHPLHVPLLAVFRAFLGLFGYDGPMLVPVEALSIASAVAAFAWMYVLARRESALAAAFAVLVAATCTGYWSAAVRPTPYAMGLVCVLATLRLCRGPPATLWTRLAASGATTALAMGFHASAMALVPVVLWCAWLDIEKRRPGIVILAALRHLGVLVAVLLLEYVVLMWFHKVDPTPVFGGAGDFGKLFKSIEQVPGTSLYTSGSLAGQAWMLAENLSASAGGLLALLALFGMAAGLASFRGLRQAMGRERHLWWSAMLSFLAFSGFFLINNARNGFVFAATCLAPVVLTRLVASRRILKWFFVPAAAAVSAVGLGRMIGDGNAADFNPVLAETRFIHEVLGPNDVLLLPGCPHPEVLYPGPVNVLAMEFPGSDDVTCAVPRVAPGRELVARLAWYARAGGWVLYSEGDLETEFDRDASGHEKVLQLHRGPAMGLAERRAWAAALREFLARWFIVAPGPITPLGRQLIALEPREGIETAAVPRPLTGDEIAGMHTGLKGRLRSYLLHRLEFLDAWHMAMPADPYYQCDLIQLWCDRSVNLGGERCRPVPGCTRRWR